MNPLPAWLVGYVMFPYVVELILLNPAANDNEEMRR